MPVLHSNPKKQIQHSWWDTLSLPSCPTRESVEEEDGKERSPTSPFTLLLTDVQVPDKEGQGLIQDILSGYPEAKVIALSGSSPSFHLNVIEMAKRLGITCKLLGAVETQAVITGK